MTWAIIGASRGLGRELARELARGGEDLVLVASGAADLAALASELDREHRVRAVVVAADLGDPGTSIGAIVAAVRGAGPLRGLLLPIGAARSDDDGTLGRGATDRLLRINLLAPMALVAALLPDLLETGGTVVGFSSVAAARGRGTNVAYAAAKRGLESYFESLRHGFAGRLCVQLYVLGYLDTERVTARTALPKGDPRRLAAMVVRDLGRSFGPRHYPRWWRIIVMGIRWIPWPIFRRLRF